jgi:hypothetical protein
LQKNFYLCILLTSALLFGEQKPDKCVCARAKKTSHVGSGEPKYQIFSLVSSEGCRFDKRQPCEEKLEREL